MNRAQVGELLAVIAGCDQREASSMSVMAWHEILSAIPIHEARAAVPIHYAATRDWIMPADIVRIVKAQRAKHAHAARKGRQLAIVEARGESIAANRAARLRRISACKGCDDAGRLLDGRFCSHDPVR